MRVPDLSLGPGVLDLDWRPAGAPGVSYVVLHLEEKGGSSAPEGAGRRTRGGTILVRMEPGRGYAPHRHVGTEDVLVLQGGYRDQHGEHRTGDHVHYPAGSAHAPVALGDPDAPVGEANPACVLFTCAPEGVEILQGSSSSS